MAGILYDAYMGHLKQKFDIPEGKLEVSHEPSIPNVAREDKTPSRHDVDHIQAMKKRWNMDGLEVEGMVKAKQTTLEDAVIETDREASKGMKLAVGSTSFKGSPMKIWFEVKL